MPRETDSEAIAEAARGEIDPELLTATGSGGFLTTGYFHDGPLIDRLRSDEHLQYIVTNLTKGITIDHSTEMERVKPSTNYRTAALVTDQRTCFVIGQAQSDATVSIPHDHVEGVTTSTGILKDKLIIHGQDADYQMYTAKQAATQATADYIEDVAPNAGWTTLESDQSNQDATADPETTSHDRDYSGVFRSRVPTDSSYAGQSSPDTDPTTESGGTTASDAAGDETAEIEGWSAQRRQIQNQTEERTVTDGRGADDAPPAAETDSRHETDVTADRDFTHSDTASEPDALHKSASESVAETQPTLPSPASVATISEEAATYIANAQDALTADLLDASRSAQIRAHANICAALEILDGSTAETVSQLETAASALETELTTPPAADGSQDQSDASQRSSSTADQQCESATQSHPTSAQEPMSPPTSEEMESSTREPTAEGTAHREALLAEFERLAAEWSTDIDKVLMYSVGEYDPADYEDEFGSWDAALRQADLEESPAGADATGLRDELLAELQRLDAEWSTDVDKVLMYSVGKYDPDDYVDEFGDWETALQTAFGDETTDDSQDGTTQTNAVEPPESADDSAPDRSTPDTATLREEDSSDSNPPHAGDAPTGPEEADVTVSRDQLLAELARLQEEWDTEPDEILMEVLGEYDPADYETVFGSWEAALRQAERQTSQEPESSTNDTDGAQATTRRDQLLAELARLQEEWDTEPDEILMEVLGEYEPVDYEDEFGSWDAALRQATLRDGESADQDTTGKQSTVTTDTSADDQTSSQEPEADFAANELAEYYDAIGLLWNILDRLLELDDLRQINTTRTTLKEWYDAVHERWSGEGVRNAPSYGEQQFSRNSFTMSEYRDVFGDGDRVTEFHRIDVQPLPPSERSVLVEQGIIADVDNFQTPVVPDSDELLPVIVENEKDLQQAKDRLAELPAWPSAEDPPAIERKIESDESRLESLPEGRLEELYVTVHDIEHNPDDRRVATLTVSLDDGSETTFTSWEKHALDYEWTPGQRYLLREARHKSWESDRGTGHKLSSTRDTTVETAETSGSAPQTDRSESQGKAGTEDQGTETDMIDSMLEDMDL